MKRNIDREFINIVKDIYENANVLELKNYIQHVYSSRYEHCSQVALLTYVVCKKMKLDYVSATRGAMLHDFYFYDYNNRKDAPKHFHLFKHPRISLENALKYFNLNVLERDVILNHMWPVTIRFPKHLETYIVTFIDKYCAVKEWGYSSCRKKSYAEKNIPSHRRKE